MRSHLMFTTSQRAPRPARCVRNAHHTCNRSQHNLAGSHCGKGVKQQIWDHSCSALEQQKYLDSGSDDAELQADCLCIAHHLPVGAWPHICVQHLHAIFRCIFRSNTAFTMTVAWGATCRAAEAPHHLQWKGRTSRSRNSSPVALSGLDLS